MTKKYAMRFAYLTLLVVMGGCAVSTPLPPDVNVQSPVSSVPKEIAAFSGKWVGRWDGRLDGTLVVENIEGRDAIMVYSWGSVPEWNIVQGFVRVHGTFGEDNVLRASLSTGVKVSYTLTPDGTLNGRYERENRISTAQFKRANK